MIELGSWMGRRALIGTLAVACVAVAVFGGDTAAGALRACALAALIALAAWAVRGAATGRADMRGLPALAVQGRLALGRETGVALIAVDRRRLVIGYAPSGVTLLADVPLDGGER